MWQEFLASLALPCVMLLCTQPCIMRPDIRLLTAAHQAPEVCMRVRACRAQVPGGRALLRAHVRVPEVPRRRGGPCAGPGSRCHHALHGLRPAPALRRCGAVRFSASPHRRQNCNQTKTLHGQFRGGKWWYVPVDGVALLMHSPSQLLQTLLAASFESSCCMNSHEGAASSSAVACRRV